MTKTAEQPTAPEPTPALPQLLAAWLEEHNAEISIGVRTPTGDAVISPVNFIPPGWTLTYVPVAKAKA